MLPDDKQVQVHLSKNDRPQPFYLICGTAARELHGRQVIAAGLYEQSDSLVASIGQGRPRLRWLRRAWYRT
jgi:hypothetical protein